MRRNLNLLLLLFVSGITNAQHVAPSLQPGDPAPPLRVNQWLKGNPVRQFEKGHVYVLEFWATWCKPCLAAMPHLSELARQYKDQVTFIGVDVYERKLKSYKSISQVRAFVDSMGSQMDYPSAAEDSSYTVADWIEAAGEQNNGIPRTFVVDGEGRLAWIGHPKALDEVLRKIVNNTWDVDKALAERNEYRRLEQLEDSVAEQLNAYVGDPGKRYDRGEPDSALLLISEIVQKEPRLKYAPLIAFHTFSALLKTDPEKAYAYGREVLVTPSYRGIDYSAITYPIEWYTEKTGLLTPPGEIFELGADAYQAEIDQYPHSGSTLPRIYLKMAEWYWRARNKTKAIEAARKAAEAMQDGKQA